MSEEKKTYNGRVQFWERGFLGVKDFDDHVIISPDLHYSEIRETDGEEAAIVRKDDKWALTDLAARLFVLSFMTGLFSLESNAIRLESM